MGLGHILIEKDFTETCFNLRISCHVAKMFFLYNYEREKTVFVQEMNNGKRHKLVRQETVFISKLHRCQIIFATSESIL